MGLAKPDRQWARSVERGRDRTHACVREKERQRRRDVKNELLRAQGDRAGRTKPAAQRWKSIWQTWHMLTLKSPPLWPGQSLPVCLSRIERLSIFLVTFLHWIPHTPACASELYVIQCLDLSSTRYKDILAQCSCGRGDLEACCRVSRLENQSRCINIWWNLRLTMAGCCSMLE